ncbi:MAG: chromosomal replication initiator protein DnaA [Oscillospiraceae bacterium]|nr:chromosomal replication initiator protein DnaA [Oscillospiraceae bacterium]
MNSFEEIFALVKSNLDIGEVAQKSWIEPIKPLRLTNNTAYLYVQAPFVKQILQENYKDTFKTLFKSILGFEVNVEILCDDDLSHEEKIKANPILELQDDKPMVEKLIRSEEGSKYRHTFDTFIEGDSNRLAYAACKAAASAKNAENPLYIYGNPGLGKTHLLFAVKNEISEKRPELNIVFTNADIFISDFVDSIKFDKMIEFKNKYRNADVLLVDDVQFFAGKKECQQELFNTFNELHSQNKQIIFTSDRTPKEINDIDERLQSRFEWGLLADISVPEYETRLAIIQRKASLYGINIPQVVMAYIADNLKINIRQLEGAITKINALSVVSDISPTMAMAKSVVKEVLDENVASPLTVDKIIAEIGSIYGFTEEEIRGKRRNAELSTARQIAIYVVQAITGLSFVEIGKQFGGRDHSTIVYAVNKVKDMIKVNKAYRHTIDDLIKNISNM